MSYIKVVMTHEQIKKWLDLLEELELLAEQKKATSGDKAGGLNEK